MTSDQANGRISQTIGSRRRRSTGIWRRRRPWLEGLESRRLLSVNIAEFPIRVEGGDPQAIAVGAGHFWFTLSSNNIGAINPGNISAGITQYPIPTANSGPGPITAGPDGNIWFFEESADQFGFINPTTDHITEIPLLGSATPGVDGMTAGPNGTIWFTENGTSQVGEISTSTDQVTLFPTITPGAEPYGIVEGPDGNMWFTEAGTNKVGMINPTTHEMQEYLIDSSGNDEAEGITVGPDHNLWFTLTGTSKIGAMNPSTGAMIGEYSTKTANSQPDSIVTGPDGNLWFTEAATPNYGDGIVGSITPKGVVTEYKTSEYDTGYTSIAAGALAMWFVGPDVGALQTINVTSHAIGSVSYTSTSADEATGIAADGSGNLWFTQETDNQIGVLNPATDITTEFTLPDTSSGYPEGPLGIALGPDGNLWFANTGYYDFYGYNGDQIGMIKPSNDAISEYSLTTTDAVPWEIVSDPADGNLWFTEESADQIGRINPTTHAVSEYPVPSANAEPKAIAVDSAGNVWFTEYSTSRIGELSPNNPNQITEYNLPGRPYGIVAGPDGNIWFSEYASGYKIGVFSPSSDTVIAQYALPSGDEAGAITVGPDGNLWYADGSGKIGTITTAGAITEYTTPKTDPVALTAGPDGNIWFTGTGTNNVIGVVTLTTVATPTQLAVATQPPGSVTAGKGFGLVVSVENAAGNPDLDYTGSVTIALAANPGGDTLKGTLTEPVVNGVAIFSGLTLKDADAGYTIQATASGLTSVTTSPFNVTLGATKLLVTTQPPASVGAGTSFGLTVSAEDGQGNVNTSYNGPITLTLGNYPSGATLGGVLILGANDGVATFTGLSLNIPFTDYTILAASGGLTSATTIGFNVTTGPAYELEVATGGEPPSSVLAGGLFSVSIVALDQFGNVATTFDGAVTLTLANGGNVTLQGNTTQNAQGGEVTFAGLSIDTVGDYQIQAASSDVMSVTTNAVNVNPRAATQLVIAPTDEPPSTVGAGSNFGFAVDATDAYGNIDPTFNGTVTIALVNAPGVTLNGSPTAKASNGVATFSSLAITTEGTYTIQASSGSLAVGHDEPHHRDRRDARRAGRERAAAELDRRRGLVRPDGRRRRCVWQPGHLLQQHGDDRAGGQLGRHVERHPLRARPGRRGDVLGALHRQGGHLYDPGDQRHPAQGDQPTASRSPRRRPPNWSSRPSPRGRRRPVSLSRPSRWCTSRMPMVTSRPADNSTQVTVALASGFGTLQGTKTVTVSGGVATFAGLYDDKAGKITLKFSASGLTGVSSSDVVIVPAATSQLVILLQPPSTASAGVAFNPSPVIYEEDQYGNLETGDNSTAITAILQSGAGPLQGATATVSGGVATFLSLADDKMETITLAFSGGGFTSATSDAVAVGPGPPAQLVITTQPYSSVTAGNPLTDPIVVRGAGSIRRPRDHR